MDHLPSVSSPALQPVEIDYLKREAPPVLQYDNKGLAGVPARTGWQKNDLLENTLAPNLQHHRDTVAEFVQQWLFFGLLSSATCHRYGMTALVHGFTQISPRSGKTVVTTKELERYLV